MQNLDAKNKYFKYAFLSAFTNIPAFENPEVFFEKEIKRLFDEYKKALSKISSYSNKFSASKKLVYKQSNLVFSPVPYCIFGDFDLAIFSLIDDFSFASKKFKPTPRGRNFKYQVNTGIIPNIEIYNEENSKLDIFQNEALPEFFSEKEFYPFTGITSIKLNNSMLIGIGQDFIELINFYIVLIIDEYTEAMQTKNNGFKLFYIINENLGWNELTIYFFSNSISHISEISSKLKINRLEELYLKITGLSTEKYNSEQISKKTHTIKDLIGKKSLLSHLISSDKKNKAKNYLESHPIVASSTIFGYHIGNLRDTLNQVNGKRKNYLSAQENIIFKRELKLKNISIAWNIKPGHEENANRIIQKSLPKSLKTRLLNHHSLYEYIQAGKYSFVFPGKLISFFEYFLLIKTANKKFKDEFVQNVIKFKSKIIFKNKNDYKKFDEAKHYNYRLHRYKIDQKTFEDIREKLRTYPVPHTIKGQIENLILNLNDAITDPLTYNYFIGLRSSLLIFLKDQLSIDKGSYKSVSNRMAKTTKPSLLIWAQIKTSKYVHDSAIFDNKTIISIKIKEFIAFIETWNKAYWNRHFHSYYFTEINDFNIEHHGGIQQILFCYDLIYKIISKRIYGEFSKEPFVNVRIDPIITSTSYNNTINFTHLFKPSVYACECVHEAANHIIPYLVNNCSNPEYDFLLNPKNVYEGNIRDRINQFEQKIKLSVGSKDSFEVKFIEEYFGLNSIRYLFTDYLSFMLAYNFDDSEKKIISNHSNSASFKNLKRYYHTHWFLFLTRADLYVMEKGKGGWYFDEEHFKFLFIRCNLMFYLMCDYDEEKLNMLNEECPSVELNVLWLTHKKTLLSFVLRLGKALRKEFCSMGNLSDDISLEKFREIIRIEILEKKHSYNPYEKYYDSIILLNHNLINSFYNYFKRSQEFGDDYYNSIIRNSANNSEIFGIKSNISFHKNHSRSLFLDPKGNIFSTSEPIRVEILKTNIEYLKNIWDVSMKASLGFYITKR